MYCKNTNIVLPTFFFQVSILSIFPIPTFLSTLSHIQIVSLLSPHSGPPLVPYFILPHFIFPKFPLISTSLYNFRKFSQQNKFCFIPTLFPPLHLPQLYTFFPLSLFFDLLPALDIFCQQCPTMSHPWSRTVSSILPVPYSSYSISPNCSSVCYFFPFKVFLSTVLRPWFRNPYTVVLKFCHSSISARVPPGRVYTRFPLFLQTCPSFNWISRRASDWYLRLLETKLCSSRLPRAANLANSQPNLTSVLLKNQRITRISTCPRLPATSHSHLGLYHIIVFS